MWTGTFCGEEKQIVVMAQRSERWIIMHAKADNFNNSDQVCILDEGGCFLRGAVCSGAPGRVRNAASKNADEARQAMISRVLALHFLTGKLISLGRI